MPNIQVDDLDKLIEEELTLYSEEITKEVKKASTEVVKELVKNTKRDANKRSGDYAKAITSKKIFENVRSISNLWYVKSPEYRLSHLLEKGHATRNGGRTPAYGFISKNEKIAIKEYEKRVEEAIKNGH